MATPRRSRTATSTTTTRVEVASDRGVFMISVAAELADMHPQTLRMYEQRGLIEPKRSPKGTRLFSHADVERLRRIQQMTVELGLNLAGVERVLALEEQLERAQRKVDALERRRRQLEADIAGPVSDSVLLPELLAFLQASLCGLQLLPDISRAARGQAVAKEMLLRLSDLLAVTWQRGGHTCVLIGQAPRAELLRLASWPLSSPR